MLDIRNVCEENRALHARSRPSNWPGWRSVRSIPKLAQALAPTRLEAGRAFQELLAHLHSAHAADVPLDQFRCEIEKRSAQLINKALPAHYRLGHWGLRIGCAQSDAALPARGPTRP